MAGAFAGGLAGSRQELCGALAAASMLVSLLHGRIRPGEDEALSRELIVRLRERFAAEYGTTRCDPIRARMEQPGVTGYCAPVAERATQMLLELLAEAPKPPSR